MAHFIRDRVLEASIVTGTGDITLTGPLTGFIAFSAIPGLNVGDTVPVSIWAVDADGTPTGDFENGVYTYSGTDTLQRTDVRESSNAGALVSFAAGDKYVALTFLSSEVMTFSRSFAQSLNFFLP